LSLASATPAGMVGVIMRKEQEERVDPAQPALIVLYGATRRKRRPLLGNVVVVGRSPTCDIGLVSPEMAPIHCLLLRLADGWHIRDCSGRATNVNGHPAHDEPLKHGDTIQIGAFSFEAHLPPGKSLDRQSALEPAAEEPSARHEHLLQSRRRLAERALRLRARVRELEAVQADLERQRFDLEQMERRLRALHQEARAKQAEGAATPEPEQQRLDARLQELDHYAAHLKRQEQRLRQREEDMARQFETERGEFEADLNRQRVEVESERRELQELREGVEQRQADLGSTAAQLEELLMEERDQLVRERASLAQEREVMEQQRQELARQRIELERLQAEAAGSSPSPASTRDTWLDARPDARLEAARRLLRELAERRQGKIDKAE
jgi:hypothetical protein